MFACALSRNATSEDNVIGSEMIRVLWYMTDLLWQNNRSE